MFSLFLENDLLKGDKILGLTFFKARKDFEGFETAFYIYCCWVLCSMDCLQLLFIRVENTVSWTQSFLRQEKFGPQIKVYWWQTNLKTNVCRNSPFQVNRKTSYLEQPSRHFCQQTFLAINLAGQQKTTKLYFSSQVKKQFKLLTVPFKPLRCCLRSDKLVILPCLKTLQRSIFKLSRDLTRQSNRTF